MARLSVPVANRLGFGLLGLTNNFAYVIMLSAAYDLLKMESENHQEPTSPSNSTEKYCNEHSTSTILLADTLPSLTIKIIYPMLFVSLHPAHKAIATSIFSALSFVITGMFTSQVLIFTGVACASLSSGLGESTFLSHTPLYGDVSLSGWSMGTGGAGVLGALAYAILSMILPIRAIMLIMLIAPVTMMFAYFYIIRPISDVSTANQSSIGQEKESESVVNFITVGTIPDLEPQDIPIRPGGDSSDNRDYGMSGQPSSVDNQSIKGSSFDMRAKIRFLPFISRYFMPLLLVYFAEYFINQGLFELIYYPEVGFLGHAAQYRWLQVSYQVGVLVSRSSLDILQIRNIWAMSILQFVNSLLFLAHASKLIFIPNFYLVIGLIIYEGLLGGFTYVNTFYRIKKEVSPEKQEFTISTVTIADSLGIVFAGLVSLPVHNALCKLYQ